MTHSNVRLWRGFLSLAMATSLVACQDGPAAPAPLEEEIALPNPSVFATYAPDEQSARITVTPSGGWFFLGRHAVYFPPNSICAPESSYGPEEWDAPCEPAREALTFDVEIVRRDGRSWLDFTPHARFVPSSSKRGWVLLFMSTSPQLASVAAREPILWSPAIGVPGVDESIEDRSVRTRHLPGTSIAWRRIKHFSGYNVGVGADEGGDGEGGGQFSEDENP